MPTSRITTETDVQRSGETFDQLVAGMQAHFAVVLAEHGPHLFHVETGMDLYDCYLDALPAEQRQHHTCHACQRFIARYGNLAAISERGAVIPALWPTEAPPPYTEAVAALRRVVAHGRVSGVAFSSLAMWGEPVTGLWTHFAVQPTADNVFRAGVLSAAQTAAAKLEDYRTLRLGLTTYDKATVAQALTLVESGTLYRTEKVLGPAQFLMALHTQRETLHGRAWGNVVWKAVAGAPAGFCQPRSTMIGTLLDDIRDGLDFTDIRIRFSEKMHPLQYQRPSAAPAAGTIAQAEKLVETLGIASALQRRFARLDEIPTVWLPTPVASPQPTNGVFGHLKSKGVQSAAPLALPAQTITWEKFARTVLPNARTIEVYVTGRMNFCALITAVDPEAKPLLQWDTDDVRNPVSWYVYNGGSPPEQWGLRSGAWESVTGVTLQPSMWAGDESFLHQGKSAILLLASCVDTHDGGLGLFPEILKAELHGVRSVIEAHSRSQTIIGRAEASACGLRVGHPGTANQIRVTTTHGVATYSIDRWD